MDSREDPAKGESQGNAQGMWQYAGFERAGKKQLHLWLPCSSWFILNMLRGNQGSGFMANAGGTMAAAAKAGEMLLSFGRYKGQNLRSVPEDYLLWMCRELQTKWKSLAIQELNQRLGVAGDACSTAAELIVPFGKHRFKALGSLPEEELQRMAREPYSNWGKLAKKVLDSRDPNRQVCSVDDMDSLKQQIKACEWMKDLEQARKIRASVAAGPYKQNRFVANMLIDLFGKCGSSEDAREVFDDLTEPNSYSWNMMLKSYTHNGRLQEAWKLFKLMPEKNVVSWNIMLAALAHKQASNLVELDDFFSRMPEKNSVSWTILLAAYIRHGQIAEARTLFDGLADQHVVTWNMMIDGYGQCGDIREARSLFDRIPHEKNAMSWNVLIAAYGQIGDVEEAKGLFDSMSVEMDQVTWNTMLAAYARNGCVEEAQEIFEEMELHDELSWASLLRAHCQGGDMDAAKAVLEKIPDKLKTHVHWTLMIDTYAKAGNMDAARQVFNGIPQQHLDSAALNAMLAAYSRSGYLQEAVALFKEAEAEHRVDSSSWTILISAYFLSGKCSEARAMFDEMKPQDKDIHPWTALVTGYVQNDLLEDAVQAFREMTLEGFEPNKVCLIGMLSPTGRACGIEKAREFFASLAADYALPPGIEHYECMVGFLGRGKRLEEAMELVNSMPFQPDEQVLMTVLSCCRMHSDIDCAKLAADKIFALNPKNAAAYVLLADIYSQTGSKKELQSLKKAVKEKQVSNTQGFSLIEVGNKVHKFLVGDTSHPWNKQIRNELRRLNKLMKEAAGYVAKSDTLELNRACKASEIHSEKLAIAYGNIISSTKNESIRLVNNLRMCSDCHSWAKLVSKLVGREIIVRDVHHIHHFEKGACSCRDTW